MRYIGIFIFAVLFDSILIEQFKVHRGVDDYILVAICPLGFMCRDIVKAIKEK